MTDGAVLCWRRDKKAKSWLQRLVQSGIVFFQRLYSRTWTDYVHAAIYLYGFTWESGAFPGWGMKRSVGVKPCDEIWVPDPPLTEPQKQKMFEHVSRHWALKLPYNVLKLFAYMLRPLWLLLDWSPFNRWWWGENCYGVVDEAYLAGGMDKVAGKRGYVFLHEFLEEGGFRRVK